MNRDQYLDKQPDDGFVVNDYPPERYAHDCSVAIDDFLSECLEKQIDISVDDYLVMRNACAIAEKYANG